MTIYTQEGSRRATSQAPRAHAGHDAGCGCGGHAAGCACPVCQGLHTFVRPRFFAGQLLTDTELTSLTSYVLDKQRLHNRYLHGYGVVCGLQVECDGCGPGVIVRPGYALDQCGNDLVVPDSMSIPIDTLIAACETTRKSADCDPSRYPSAKGCDDGEQTWCLWVRYREQQARPVTPLGGAPASTVTTACGCGGTRTGGCGCGGTNVGTTRATSGCGCGGTGHTSRATTCGCTNAPAQASRPAGCEPSRVYECIEFGVAPSDDSCDDWATALAGTFPAKVVECVQHLQPLLTKGMSRNYQASALSMVTGGTKGLSTGVARDALCQLYANVLDLYRNDPMRTQCVVPEELREIDCSPKGPNESTNDYANRLVLGLQQLVMLVLLYLRDCVCYAALPPCPGPACDDRVVLACLTVKQGVVTRICNHACRRYAGSFVNRDYWLPIGPALSLLAAKLCCFPLSLPRIGRDISDNDRARVTTNAVRPLSLRRYDNLLSALRADDFALIGLWRRRAAQAMAKLRVGAVLASAERSLERTRGSVRLASYLHSDAAEAANALAKKGVEVNVVKVSDLAEGLSSDLIPRVAEGSRATLFVMGGRVVGVRGSEGIDLSGRMK